jgi:hypothetical protein
MQLHRIAALRTRELFATVAERPRRRPGERGAWQNVLSVPRRLRPHATCSGHRIKAAPLLAYLHYRLVARAAGLDVGLLAVQRADPRLDCSARGAVVAPRAILVL